MFEKLYVGDFIWKESNGNKIKEHFCLGLDCDNDNAGRYWQKVIHGVTEAAEQIDAAVYLGGIDNETDVSGQISLIEKAEQQGADGILLTPANSNTLVKSCQKIKNQNISLVLIDSSINSDAYDTCYMTGNFAYV